MLFRYDTSGQWFKGNTHIHSTASDGGKSFIELADMYAGAGYRFLFRTDHWVCSDVSADENDSPLLWLDGIEIDGVDLTGAYYHVVCLGTPKQLERADDFALNLNKAHEQGALLIAAHPHWCGNSTADCLRYPFDGVEIYNHVCRWLNGKSSGLVHWDAMLQKAADSLGFAVDDAHLTEEHPGWNGGWIVVNIPELTRENILDAIRSGNFYSSRGPEFFSIECDGENVSMTTSPVRYIRLVGPGHRGQRLGTPDGPLLSEARMRVPGIVP